MEILGVQEIRATTPVRRRCLGKPECQKYWTATNEAFDRYLEVTGDELRGLYADTKTDNKVITFSRQSEGDKPLKTIDKDGARGET